MLLTSFATKAWIVCLVALLALVLFVRLMWWLGRASENGVAMLVRLGMHRMAKDMLSLLIGYNVQTYSRSKFVLWNQVAPRFALLWSAVIVAIILAGTGQWGIFSLYVTVLVTILLLSRLGRQQVFDPYVKEQYGRQSGVTYIRPWNYLDELYAQ